MSLTRMEFTILNALADGSEPFSMIYLDCIETMGEDIGVKRIVAGAVELAERGFVQSDNGGRVVQADLIPHYDDLGKELKRHGDGPFYYSKGELFVEMTSLGREEWDRYEYPGRNGCDGERVKGSSGLEGKRLPEREEGEDADVE